MPILILTARFIGKIYVRLSMKISFSGPSNRMPWGTSLGPPGGVRTPGGNVGGTRTTGMTPWKLISRTKPSIIISRGGGSKRILCEVPCEQRAFQFRPKDAHYHALGPSPSPLPSILPTMKNRKIKEPNFEHNIPHSPHSSTITKPYTLYTA